MLKKETEWGGGGGACTVKWGARERPPRRRCLRLEPDLKDVAK